MRRNMTKRYIFPSGPAVLQGRLLEGDPLLPARLGRRGRHRPGPLGGDKFQRRVRAPGRRHPAASGASAVEVIQVAGQVGGLHRSKTGQWTRCTEILPAGPGRPLAASSMDVAEVVTACQPSVKTVAPGSTSVTNGCSDAADASASGSMRQRPSPFGSRTSTAMPVSTFLPLARPPASPGCSPPM